MIKDIVVNLALVGANDPAAAYAVSVARTFGAHLTGIVFVYDPVISPSIMDGVSAEWIDAQRDESRTMAQAAIESFERATEGAGVQAEHRIIEATLGGATDMFGRIARRFDLVVVGQREPDRMSPADLFAEGALFESGRPVVMVPYIQKEGLRLGRVLMCWDGSRTAARAMGDAMPFLARAKQVDVVIVATGRAKSDEIPGADVGHHLARHGIKVDVKRIVAEDVDVPNTILSYAADVSADFVVMGGYGHSRLREFVLGGATRGILGSMTIPVLMSH
ncbi:MAG: universal stress protein [Rhodoplanes sp.]|uniref:universal stress protein n=1 Tax=Rhodoplanes sp. TaxID=1968906 RepID=UPI0017E85779|nr:universal stress protein [Rhodoplanes sp.]NVO17372.1 universal stress protein [Rhodoplanes sp.]